MSKQPPSAPTASEIGPCPTVIKIVGRPGTGSLPSTFAPPDHPGPFRQYFSIYRAVSIKRGRKRRERVHENKNVDKPPPEPIASAVGPCPSVIQNVGRPGTGGLPRTVAPLDYPKVPWRLFCFGPLVFFAVCRYLSLFVLYTNIKIGKKQMINVRPAGWLVGCFGLNGPLRQYFSLYRAVSQSEGERGEKKLMRVKMSKQPPPAPTASAVGPCPTAIKTGRPALEVYTATSHHPTTP